MSLHWLWFEHSLNWLTELDITVLQGTIQLPKWWTHKPKEVTLRLALEADVKAKKLDATDTDDKSAQDDSLSIAPDDDALHSNLQATNSHMASESALGLATSSGTKRVDVRNAIGKRQKWRIRA